MFSMAHELDYVSQLTKEDGEGYYYVKARSSMKIVEDVPNKVA